LIAKTNFALFKVTLKMCACPFMFSFFDSEIKGTIVDLEFLRGSIEAAITQFYYKPKLP